MRNPKKIINQLCNANVEDFCKHYECTDTPNGPLIHIDNGGDVLAVAHLDTVMESKPKWRGSMVKCPQLDDRLGVWALLHLLPTLTDIPYDILLTDNEESGQSTSSYFEPDKQYNWIFEFDRAGSDVALYEYEDKKTKELMSSFDWKVGMGSFTDICSLEHLSIKAFNFGTGYHCQHTKGCFADIKTTYKNVKKFTKFLTEYHSTLLPHTPIYTPTSVSYKWRKDDLWEDEYLGYDSNNREENECDYCSKELLEDWVYCPFCRTECVHTYV